ncbi:class E sortase [Nesterenkonia alba]|uniref:class E sortase n=1 Tax=Nesterenkonia alba TaxID=515814 RepID=UPI0003B5A32A|nr:class E sortase [Nesterenkonia alba]
MTVTAPRHAATGQRGAPPSGPPAPPSRRDSRSGGRPRRRRSVASTIIGGIGELLITLGVLGLLFVVWELWWTGIEADSERQETLEQFYSDDGLQAAPARETGGPDPADFEVCMTLEDGTEIGCADYMAEQTGWDDVMGVMYAPRLGEDWAAPIRHGVGREQIDRGGVGHYPDTQLPGELGNFAVAGHRNTYASMLGNQDALQTGDQIYVVSAGDGMFIYEVAERRVVQPNETDVLLPVPGEPDLEPETGILTLTTCHPMYSNAERLIHHAEIVDFIPLGGEAPEDIAHHEGIDQLFYTGDE